MTIWDQVQDLSAQARDSMKPFGLLGISGRSGMMAAAVVISVVFLNFLRKVISVRRVSILWLREIS
jgi:hypothetical protein